MYQQVMIFPYADQRRADWVSTDQDGTQCVIAGQLSACKVDKETRVIVVIPGQEVLLTQVTLPPVKARYLAQALPFALEDQLLDELEALHFAVGPYQPGTPVAIAVIKKKRLEQWLLLLKEQHIQPDFLIPAPFILPAQPGHWQLAVIADSLTVRTAGYHGFSCETQQLPTLLSLRFKEEQPPATSLIVYQTEALAQEALSALSAASPLPLTFLQQSPTQLLEALSQRFAKSQAINLLQPPYSPPLRLTWTAKHKQAWFTVAALLAINLGLLLLTNLGSWLLLSYERYHLHQQIQLVYQNNGLEYPAIEWETAKQQLTEQLHALLAKDPHKLFLRELAILAKAATAIDINKLEFHGQQMRLEITAAALSQIHEFLSLAQSLGLMIAKPVITFDNNQYQASIIVEKMTS